MAQKLPIPILAGNSYEISSLSLAISKGYGFRFNNLPQGNCKSSIGKLVRVLDYLNVRLPLKRITLSSETSISTKHFSFIELSLFMSLYALKHPDISNQLSSILFLGRVDLHGNILPPIGLYNRILRELEIPLIGVSLEATGGNQAKCADLLGLNRNTLRKKIKELDIKVTRRRKLM